MQRLRLHISEITASEAKDDLVATRYFPSKDISTTTAGVDHVTPMLAAIQARGWQTIGKRGPSMFKGRKIETIEYKRDESFMLVTVYREGKSAWAFVKIRGIGSDAIELREWMEQYEGEYGRVRV